MKLKNFARLVTPCAAIVLFAVGNAHASTIAGSIYCGISSNTPTLANLSSVATSANHCADFNATEINFQSPPGAYTLNGFLTSEGASTGASAFQRFYGHQQPEQHPVCVYGNGVFPEWPNVYGRT